MTPPHLDCTVYVGGRRSSIRWRPNSRLTALCLAGMLPILAASRSSAAETDYIVTSKRDGDKASLAVTEKLLTVRVVSKMGIGTIRLKRPKTIPEWPETIELRIQQSDGTALQELEGFHLRGATIRVEGSRRTSGKMDCYDGPPGERKPGEKPSRQVDVRVVKTTGAKTPGAMLIRVPGVLLRGQAEAEIGWVDYYRN